MRSTIEGITRVGIVGAGYFGEKHATAIGQLTNVELVGAYRRDTAALEAFTQKYGIKGYADHEELIDDPVVDVVLIATPHHLHTDIALRAVAGQKHILVEKPMAANLEDCDRILRAVDGSSSMLMVGHISHFFSSYRRAKEILESGEVGELVYGISVMEKGWMESNRRSWHLDRKTGGGMWLTAGMHGLDRLTWLTGSEIGSVCAQFDTRFHRQQADDVGVIFLRFRNGTFGTIVSTGYSSGVSENTTHLVCTKGMIDIDLVDGVKIGSEGKWQTVPDSGAADVSLDGLIAEWRAFVDAIRNGGESPVSGRFARHIMAACFAAEESSKTRSEVEVPPIEVPPL
jgi:predicted dehydrogenase